MRSELWRWRSNLWLSLLILVINFPNGGESVQCKGCVLRSSILQNLCKTFAHKVNVWKCLRLRWITFLPPSPLHATWRSEHEKMSHAILQRTKPTTNASFPSCTAILPPCSLESKLGHQNACYSEEKVQVSFRFIIRPSSDATVLYKCKLHINISLPKYKLHYCQCGQINIRQKGKG